MVFELLDALASCGRDPQHGGVLQKSPAGDLTQLLHGQISHSRLYQIDLVEHQQAVAHAQKIHDLQVLSGLGHDPVISRHDQQHQINARGPGHHVAQEALVPGHIHQTDLTPVGQGHARKTQVNGHAALLFLGPTVRIDAREHSHQG